jgi:hypothetical protein
MPQASKIWSKQRQAAARRVAAILYGVVAVMTAEITVQPGELGHAQAALGALLVGLAMMVTRVFVEVVKKETEMGARLPISKAGAILNDSLLVMVFPGATALLIIIAARTTAQWQILLDLVLYLGMTTVAIVGFSSSYMLDRQIRPALARGSAWLLLSLVLVAAKGLT